MLHQKEPHELALASTAVLLHLLQRLVDDKLLKREAARAILGNAADALIANPIEASEAHHKASDLIRKELVQGCNPGAQQSGFGTERTSRMTTVTVGSDPQRTEPSRASTA
jgi:hypothetical protein